MTQSFKINTLHRVRYMLLFFILLIIFGIICSKIPVSEMFKVVAILFTVPVVLFLSVYWSKNMSVWSIDSDNLKITFGNKEYKYAISEIDHIKSLTRSGGNLYVIHFKNKYPKRFWRNKLFTSDDDQVLLQEALTNSTIEYYKM